MNFSTYWVGTGEILWGGWGGGGLGGGSDRCVGWTELGYGGRMFIFGAFDWGYGGFGCE